MKLKLRYSACIFALMLALIFMLSACGGPRKIKEIKSAQDLEGLIVGCQISTTADLSLKEMSKTIKFKEIKRYDQIIQTFSELKTGRIDAVVVDEVVARYYIAKDPKSYKVAGSKLTNEPAGIFFRKEDNKMRDTVNRVISELRTNGKLSGISVKWFGMDITSNLILPEFLKPEDTNSNTTENGFEGKTVLKIGVDDTYPPMEYRDKKNNLVGFDVDFAKAIAEKLNLQAEFIPTAWDGIFAALTSSKYDCIISTCSIDAGRIKAYSITDAYIANAQVIVTRP